MSLDDKTVDSEELANQVWACNLTAICMCFFRKLYGRYKILKTMNKPYNTHFTSHLDLKNPA